MIKIIIKFVSCLLVGAWLITMYQAKFGANNPATLLPDFIVVGTTTNNPPFMFWHNGHNNGFEPELVQEIAQRMGKKIIIRELPQSSLIDALHKGAIQLAITDETQLHEEKNVILSQHYRTSSPHSLFALANNSTLLLQQLETVLEEMKEDGSLTDLQKKWQLF